MLSFKGLIFKNPIPARKGKYKTKEVCKMELAVVKNELAPTFVNRDLNRATKKIATISGKIKKNFFEIALIMADVQNRELYKDDGFKNAADYAMQIFGYKKSMVYSLIKIGKEYTNPELAESNLPHEDSHDFTVAQIDRMLTLERDEVVELVEGGEISPDMSCAEINKVVQARKHAGEEDTGDEGNEVAGVEEENEQERAMQKLRDALQALLDVVGNKEGVCDIVADVMTEFFGE